MTTRRIWKESERAILADLFPDNYTEAICKKLNRSYGSVANQAFLMGLKKSKSFKEMELSKQGLKLKEIGKANRFKEGFTPHNKGKKQPINVVEKMRPTMFKKGCKPHNSYNNWVEVVRKDKSKKDYWFIKVPGEQKIKPKHIWIWEEAYGKVEKGFNVVFKDKNPMNCTLENLECISNSELMKRNTIHRYPVELKSTIRLVNKLKRTIHEKQN
jgi:hypothetical protein